MNDGANGNVSCRHLWVMRLAMLVSRFRRKEGLEILLGYRLGVSNCSTLDHYGLCTLQ